MLPIAFLTYCPWPFEHTAHDLSRIRQQETFVVDQSFGVGGTGARCGGAPQVPFTQVRKKKLRKFFLTQFTNFHHDRPLTVPPFWQAELLEFQAKAASGKRRSIVRYFIRLSFVCHSFVARRA